MVKNLPSMPETQIQSLGQEDPLQKGMATHSSIIAWRIPWTEELGGLQSVGSQTQTQLRDILVGSCQHLLMALDPECSQLSQLFPNQLCSGPLDHALPVLCELLLLARAGTG